VPDVPELPEVETVRRQLAPRLTGRRLLGAGSHPSAKFTPAQDAVGATVTAVGRRGKFLLVALDDQRELVIHLGMTGQLRFRPGGADLGDPYLRAWWLLEGDEALEYADVRRFGRLRVVPAGCYDGLPTLASLGPEPFDPAFTGVELWRRLATSSRPVKTQLLSQRPVAGVGNIYADEALWLAGISPRARRLSVRRATALLDALRDVLAQGIDHGGTTLRDYRTVEGGTGGNQHHLHAYGRSGLPCERCGTALRSAVIDARTATWCPRCQAR
jgi:formamidopyrimidine-DNA glycosylase